MQIRTGQKFGITHRFTQAEFDRFAELTGDDNPIHVDPAFSAQTRFGGTVAHGMLLYGLICRVLNTGINNPSAIQISQELMFQHPTHTQTEVRVECSVIEFNKDLGQACFKTDVILPDGRKACDGRAVMQLIGHAYFYPDLDERFVTPQPSGDQRYKGLEIGQSASVTRVFRGSDLDGYSELTGDRHSLISNAADARKLGFRDRLVPGSLISGMFSDLLGTRLPGRGTNWLKQQLHFAAPAYVDEALTARVEITRLRPDKELVNLMGSCTNPAGECLCRAQSLVLVKDLAHSAA